MSNDDNVPSSAFDGDDSECNQTSQSQTNESSYNKNSSQLSSQCNESSYNNNSSAPTLTSEPSTSVIDTHGPKKSLISNLYNNHVDESSTSKVPISSTSSCDNDIISVKNNQSIYSNMKIQEEDKKTDGDVEKFGGKIVYNPDGSAYIIEDGDLSDDDSLLTLPKHEGSIIERPGKIFKASFFLNFSKHYNKLKCQFQLIFSSWKLLICL